MYWFQKRDESDRWMKQADKRSNKGDKNYVDEEKGDTREEERVCLVKRRALLWPYKYDRRPRQVRRERRGCLGAGDVSSWEGACLQRSGVAKMEAQYLRVDKEPVSTRGQGSRPISR